jgi:hypothetical protein
MTVVTLVQRLPLGEERFLVKGGRVEVGEHVV